MKPAVWIVCRRLARVKMVKVRGADPTGAKQTIGRWVRIRLCLAMTQELWSSSSASRKRNKRKQLGKQIGVGKQLRGAIR